MSGKLVNNSEEEVDSMEGHPNNLWLPDYQNTTNRLIIIFFLSNLCTMVYVS
eukprot:UN05414